MFNLETLQVHFNQNQVLNLSRTISLNLCETALLVGETGSGKSTFLGAISGLVPQFTGGQLKGQGSLGSQDLFCKERRFDPADVALVFQNPFEGFVQSTVRNEILFSARINQSPLLTDQQWFNRIVQATNVSHLVERNLDSLSDGEAQRVAIAAALYMRPKLLLLDEPTSALDLLSAKQLRDLLKQLQHEFQFMLILSEHRYDIWLESVDKIWLLQSAEISQFTPAVFALESGLPVLNTQVLRELEISSMEWQFQSCRDLISQMQIPDFNFESRDISSPAYISVHGLSLELENQQVLRNLTFEIMQGGVCAVLGPSGAGKTSLLHALAGDFPLTSGSVLINQKIPQSLSSRDLLGNIALVPQQPGNLFVSETVSGECELADRWRGLMPGTTLQFLERFNLGTNLTLHPRDLSAGAQLWLALAIAIAANPKVLILDEPTRGLDSRGKTLLLELIRERHNQGLTTIWATHDIELAAGISDQLIYLVAGELRSCGAPTANVHPELAALSPIHDLLGNEPYLSLEQLRQASASKK